ncbi:hypothetical protein GH751_17155 [Acinetobacter baumannii]|nr:hypothetical protein [Acinetobacter baumannii]
MSFSKIYTRGLLGLHAPLIEVEVHVSQGLPSLALLQIVGGDKLIIPFC